MQDPPSYFRESCPKRPKFWLYDVFSPLLFEYEVENLQKLTVSEISAKNMIFARKHLYVWYSKILYTWSMVLMLGQR